MEVGIGAEGLRTASVDLVGAVSCMVCDWLAPFVRPLSTTVEGMAGVGFSFLSFFG